MPVDPTEVKKLGQQLGIEPKKKNGFREDGENQRNLPRTE